MFPEKLKKCWLVSTQMCGGAKQRAVALRELSDAQAIVQGKAMSALRDVAVSVDAAGQLIDLQITNRALQRGGDRLAAEILALVAPAKLHAQSQVHAAAAKLLGADDPLLAAYPADVPSYGGSAVGSVGPRLGYEPRADREDGDV